MLFGTFFQIFFLMDTFFLSFVSGILSSGPLSSVSNCNSPSQHITSDSNCASPTASNGCNSAANAFPLPSPISPTATAASPCGNVSTSSSNENNITMRFSGHTLDKATKAKVILENYYSNLISQHKERKNR